MVLTPDRCAGALLGLAAGDCLGAPTENLSRAAIVRRYGWLADLGPEHGSGTDDTEFAVLTARAVLRFGRTLDPATIAGVWREELLGQDEPFRTGGFSELAALALLRHGADPPVTGTDHVESFSDGAAMRAAPLGLVWPGRPRRAAALAAADAAVSHARDGIWCAQAVASAVAVAVTTTDPDRVLAAALDALPAGSWSRHLAGRALSVAASAADGPSAADALVEAVALRAYPWTDAAPEALALALGAFRAAGGSYRESVCTAVNLGRDADTIAAMAGAMAGALHGLAAVPPHWRRRVATVRGDCILATAGQSLTGLADELVAAVRRWERGGE